MEYKFTKDILGSNNGYDVQSYKEGDIIDEKDLCEVLLDAWKEQEVIVPTSKSETEETEGIEGTEEVLEEENSNTGDKEVDDFLNGETDEVPEGTEEISEEEALILEAKDILEVPEGANLSDEDIAKLKEIGIALEIKGMEKTENPKKIVEKVVKFIDENSENTDDDDKQA